MTGTDRANEDKTDDIEIGDQGEETMPDAPHLSGDAKAAGSSGAAEEGKSASSNRPDWVNYDPFDWLDNEVEAPTSESQTSVPGEHAPNPESARGIDDITPTEGIATAPDAWQRKHAERHENAEYHQSTGYVTTQSTQAHYIYRANRFLSRYMHARGLASYEDVSYEDFAHWMLQFQPPITRKNTWRLYRNAAIYYLEGCDGPEAGRAIALLRNPPGTTGGMTPNVTRHYPNKPQTSDRKAKSVSSRFYERMRFYIDNFMTSQYRDAIRDMMEATLTAGLRPEEWATALVVDEAGEDGENREILKVLSGKTTNDRGNVIVRSIDITDVDETRKTYVRRMAKRGAEWAENDVFSKYLKSMRQRMREINRALRGKQTRNQQVKRVTFYTFRHQFIANAKAHLDMTEVAAIVGHNEIVTQMRHYGRRRSAWASDVCPNLPRGKADEIALVQERLQQIDHERQRQMFRDRLASADMPNEEPEEDPDPDFD